LEEEIRTAADFEGIVGRVRRSDRYCNWSKLSPTSDSTVLLLGETGTGKELIAQAIHDRSRRKRADPHKAHCAAIPTGLLESELFGHERGAFTGAITPKLAGLELPIKELCFSTKWVISTSATNLKSLGFSRDEISHSSRKQSSLIGQFKSRPTFWVMAPCEGAAFVAEEFTLQKTRRNGRAVDFMKGPLFAPAAIVDRLGDQFS